MSKCVGCTACVSVCPVQCLRLNKNSEGFFQPNFVQKNDCINCGACDEVCPISNLITLTQNNVKAYAAYSNNEKIRKISSSGGVFSEIANLIMNDGGVVYGAIYDEKFAVRHECIKDKKDLYKLCGAKYAQSDLDNCFLDIKKRLIEGQMVLFSGTPCQVAGLKKFLRKPWKNLFTVDFVCHGIPSPLVWEKYIQYRSKKDSGGKLPQLVNLRSKITGWSRYNYSVEYKYSDSAVYMIKNNKDIFMKLFVGDYINNTSCSDCHFKGYNRVSDITLGDFWGIWDILPDMDDNRGTSLVLVHSESGRQMMNKISDKIKAKEVTLQQASEQNPSLLISSAGKSNRNLILQKCINGQFDEVRQILSEQQNQSNQKKYIKVLRKLYHKLRNE